MAYIALGLLLLLGLVALGHAFVRANPRTLAKLLKVAAVVAAAFLALVMLVTGRAASLIGIAPLLLFALLGWKQAARRRAAAGGPSPGRSSTVATRYFRMSLDHDTGTVSGEVTEGRFSGRSLADLSLEDLLALRRECADDAQSVSVLEAYLDKLHPDWRGGASDSSQEPPAGAGGAMTLDEARAILGVGPGASEDEIRDAHRRLMQKLHPDRGGSTYLAAQINRARDLLLGQ
ncbi:MAG: putative heat shock protein DnaJ, N-terminal [Rhodospirillales bacterium]|nr:putative heat shock protein DnaJ, N-terminal [Rhodospirillales bacterium]